MNIVKDVRKRVRKVTKTEREKDWESNKRDGEVELERGLHAENT